MKEIRDIVQAFHNARKQNKQTALATVVHVEGSSYRRPGARMLITEDGQLTGAISGGCLEGDALRKAQLVMTEKRSMLVTYDTMDEDDAKLGVGLGCNGIIQVLIEPINPEDPHHPVALLERVSSERQQAVLVTLFSLADKKKPQYGTCLLLAEQGDCIDHAPVLNELLKTDAAIALIQQTSSFKNYAAADTNYSAFIEFIRPVVSLVIVGAGNDVMPLAAIAGVLGWETRIVDGRSNYARPERFPTACQVLLAKPEEILQQVSVDEQTVFTLMTHNYNYDLAVLKALLLHNVRYVGLLGPKKKLTRILDELKEQGTVFTDEQLAAVHGPIGLDIGAETPEEIALSIVAEIKAVLADRKGQLLKHSNAPIHNRASAKIEETKLSSTTGEA